jgi:hypothetical protein
VEDIDEELVNHTDKRIFAIASAFHQGYSVDEIWQMTKVSTGEVACFERDKYEAYLKALISNGIVPTPA